MSRKCRDPYKEASIDIAKREKELLQMQKKCCYALFVLTIYNCYMSTLFDRYFFVLLAIVSVAQLVWVYNTHRESSRAYYKERAKEALGIDQND
jgi:cbb3-type cytochrome oxidase subunit 3